MNHIQRDHRRHFIAQRGICPLCGHMMGGAQKKMQRRSWDHVWPRAKGYTKKQNKILVHEECNGKKADRHPFPCEVLYLQVTNELMCEIPQSHDWINRKLQKLIANLQKA